MHPAVEVRQEHTNLALWKTWRFWLSIPLSGQNQWFEFIYRHGGRAVWSWYNTSENIPFQWEKKKRNKVLTDDPSAVCYLWVLRRGVGVWDPCHRNKGQELAVVQDYCFSVETAVRDELEVVDGCFLPLEWWTWAHGRLLRESSSGSLGVLRVVIGQMICVSLNYDE